MLTIKKSELEALKGYISEQVEEHPKHHTRIRAEIPGNVWSRKVDTLSARESDDGTKISEHAGEKAVYWRGENIGTSKWPYYITYVDFDYTIKEGERRSNLVLIV